MRLKHLESNLSSVQVFDKPKVFLEQYPTTPYLAASMIHLAHQNDDIEDLYIGDFGVGTGMLSIASCLMGSYQVQGIDVDIDALNIAQLNTSAYNLNDRIDFLQSDIQDVSFANKDNNNNNNNNNTSSYQFDTIVMNPPFGTKNTGIDTCFVIKAMECSNVVYSLHKTSTRSHFEKLALENSWDFQVAAEMKFDIPKTFKFHKEKSKDIMVDLYRISHTI